MDSRKQFEEWITARFGDIYHNEEKDYRFVVWQAGRASMRDEAVKVCEERTDRIAAIKEIQP